jgi:cell division protein FtsB
VTRQRQRLVQLAVPFALAAATVGVLAVGVYPTRAYLDKREQVHASEVELAELRAANDDAAAFAELLDSDDEIERVARAELGLAKPGEETYVVLPPPAATPQVPDGWPFTKIDLRRNLSP